MSDRASSPFEESTKLPPRANFWQWEDFHLTMETPPPPVFQTGIEKWQDDQRKIRILGVNPSMEELLGSSFPSDIPILLIGGSKPLADVMQNFATEFVLQTDLT